MTRQVVGTDSLTTTKKRYHYKESQSSQIESVSLFKKKKKTATDAWPDLKMSPFPWLHEKPEGCFSQQNENGIMDKNNSSAVVSFGYMYSST